LPAELADDAERRRRFFTEARAASALNHPHVCVVFDVGGISPGSAAGETAPTTSCVPATSLAKTATCGWRPHPR
jgi:hypothetical protein